MDESVKRKIRKEIFRNLALLGQKKRLDGILSFEHPRGDATPCIQYENGTYYYVISERGREFSRKETSDLNELMFLVFEALTFSMAVRWEVEHRDEKRDCRRKIFAKQEELIALYNGPEI